MNMKNEAARKLEWIEFSSIDDFISTSKYLRGVYILAFNTDVGPITLYTGSGNIKDRMRIHKDKEDIIEYDVNVYCAETIEEEMKGIEAYLDMMLKPTLGKRSPNAEPIPVNLPDWFHEWKKYI